MGWFFTPRQGLQDCQVKISFVFKWNSHAANVSQGHKHRRSPEHPSSPSSWVCLLHSPIKTDLICLIALKSYCSWLCHINRKDTTPKVAFLIWAPQVTSSSWKFPAMLGVWSPHCHITSLLTAHGVHIANIAMIHPVILHMLHKFTVNSLWLKSSVFILLFNSPLFLSYDELIGLLWGWVSQMK